MTEAMGEARTALVTGGSRGIGAEIAGQLCGAGYRVVITGRDPERLSETAERIGAVGVVSDAAEPGSAARVVNEAVQRFGQLDLLVNNAGTGGPGGPLLPGRDPRAHRPGRERRSLPARPQPPGRPCRIAAHRREPRR